MPLLRLPWKTCRGDTRAGCPLARGEEEKEEADSEQVRLCQTTYCILQCGMCITGMCMVQVHLAMWDVQPEVVNGPAASCTVECESRG